MLVVSNTSPICNLAIIGRLSLLRSQYGRVLVPPAVVSELAALSHLAARASIDSAYHEGWLAREAIPSPNALQELRMKLDRGEAEAIALAAAKNADLLLIDERLGRAEARNRKLNIAGVLGVLLEARFSAQLPSVRDEIRKLRIEAHFFISPEIESFIISQAGE